MRMRIQDESKNKMLCTENKEKNKESGESPPWEGDPKNEQKVSK